MSNFLGPLNLQTKVSALKTISIAIETDS